MITCPVDRTTQCREACARCLCMPWFPEGSQRLKEAKTFTVTLGPVTWKPAADDKAAQ